MLGIQKKPGLQGPAWVGMPFRFAAYYFLFLTPSPLIQRRNGEAM